MWRRAVAAIQSLLGQRRTRNDIPDILYPSPEKWEFASPRQAARAARSFAELKKRAVLVYPGPLFVDDDQKATLQSAADVARRVMILWGLNLRAEGFTQAKAKSVIDGLELRQGMTANELAFLEAETVDPNDCQARVWQLEAIWVLLWALGHVEELAWPGGMCDVEMLVHTVIPAESDPTFISGATLRPVGEILDQQDLTLRLHWAIRHALLHQGGVVAPELDWTVDDDPLPINLCAATQVVERRHHALNWLLKTHDPEDWDAVETHT